MESEKRQPRFVIRGRETLTLQRIRARACSRGDLRVALPQKLPARKVMAVAAQVALPELLHCLLATIAQMLLACFAAPQGVPAVTTQVVAVTTQKAQAELLHGVPATEAQLPLTYLAKPITATTSFAQLELSALRL